MIPNPQHSDLDVFVVLVEPVHQLVNSFQLPWVLICWMAGFQFTSQNAVIQRSH